jgi:hypothetical protein
MEERINAGLSRWRPASKRAHIASSPQRQPVRRTCHFVYRSRKLRLSGATFRIRSPERLGTTLNPDTLVGDTDHQALADPGTDAQATRAAFAVATRKPVMKLQSPAAKHQRRHEATCGDSNKNDGTRESRSEEELEEPAAKGRDGTWRNWVDGWLMVAGRAIHRLIMCMQDWEENRPLAQGASTVVAGPVPRQGDHV